ncbi:methyltransferase domain-containing protein [Nocardiopsis sp. CNT-189]|uniref:methyltransferase domain-containing protein n=1 Tax=Nocardiopsis oceanisediminis TaxID=2816862 RepID=UPI003B3A860A
MDRSAFIPETVWTDTGDDGVFRPYPRADPDVQAWMHQDYALVTQVDDGSPAGPDGTGVVPTSSISQPSLVVAMLEALELHGGERVLEIGTGTGYNTALLCERLGSENVVSVEVDPVVAEQARRTLHGLGYKPALIVGDGAADVPGQEPFDHVLSTVAARRIPPAWIAQARPSGRIVAPWGPGFTSAALLRLVVDEDGSAHGRLLRDAAFMWLRDQRRPIGSWRDFVDEDDPAAAASEIPVNPRVVSDRASGWGVVLGHLVPGLGYASYEAAENDLSAAGEATVYIYDREGSGSWGVGEYTPAGAPYEAQRRGPRDLWTEVTAARTTWEEAGRPGRDRLGLTVERDGRQVLWVDDPTKPLD